MRVKWKGNPHPLETFNEEFSHVDPDADDENTASRRFVVIIPNIRLWHQMFEIDILVL